MGIGNDTRDLRLDVVACLLGCLTVFAGIATSKGLHTIAHDNFTPCGRGGSGIVGGGLGGCCLLGLMGLLGRLGLLGALGLLLTFCRGGVVQKLVDIAALVERYGAFSCFFLLDSFSKSLCIGMNRHANTQDECGYPTATAKG